MTLLFPSFILVAADEKSGPKKGVVSHGKRKILLTEKIVNAQFLVLYLKVDIQLTERQDKMKIELQNMWQMMNYRCCLNFSNTSENDFQLDWLLKEKEVSFADKDLNKIKQKVSSFLKGTKVKKKHRSRR